MRDHWDKAERLHLKILKFFKAAIKEYNYYLSKFRNANFLLKILYVLATFIFAIGVLDFPFQLQSISQTAKREIKLVPYRFYSLGCFLRIESYCIKKKYSTEYVTSGTDDSIYSIFEPVIYDKYLVGEHEYPHPSYRIIFDNLLIEGFLVRNMEINIATGSMEPNWDITMTRCNGDTDCFHNQLVYEAEGLISLETIVDNIPEKKIVLFKSEIVCNLTEGVGYKCGNYLLGDIVKFAPRAILCESNNKSIINIKSHCG